MDWKEMLEKHGKELAEFEDRKKEEWEKLIRYGEPTQIQREKYREQYWKEYNTLVKENHFEARFIIEKEKLDKAHLNWLKEQARAFPEVTHWQTRIDEVVNKDLEKAKTKDKEIDKDRD